MLGGSFMLTLKLFTVHVLAYNNLKVQSTYICKSTIYIHHFKIKIFSYDKFEIKIATNGM